MCYLRLWRQFAVMAFVREAEYRVNFLLGVGEGAAQLALPVVTFLLIYRFTPRVAGWSQAQVLLLVGIYRIVDGLLNLQVAPNMLAISGYIRRGEMDFLLLRPVSSQFLVSLRMLALPEAVNALIGCGVAIYAGHLSSVRWSIVAIGEAAVFMLCGLILLYALWFTMVTCSFWLVQVDTLDTLFYSVFETARYPVTFFKGLVRGVDLRDPCGLCHHLPGAGTLGHRRSTPADCRHRPGHGSPHPHAPVLELRRALLQQCQQLSIDFTPGAAQGTAAPSSPGCSARRAGVLDRARTRARIRRARAPGYARSPLGYQPASAVSVAAGHRHRLYPKDTSDEHLTDPAPCSSPKSPSSKRAGLPALLAAADPPVELPAPTPVEDMALDQAAPGMTPGRHVLTYLRPDLRHRPLRRAHELAALPTATVVEVVGQVIARQQPPTARGVLFLSWRGVRSCSGSRAWSSGGAAIPC